MNERAGLGREVGMLCLKMDSSGKILALEGRRQAAWDPVVGKRLEHCVSADSAALLDTQWSRLCSRAVDLEFTLSGLSSRHWRGLLSPEGEGWQMQLIDIDDLLLSLQQSETARQSLLDAAQMSARLASSSPARLQAETAELLEELASGRRLSNLALVLEQEPGQWQVYAHYHRFGVARVWEDGTSLSELLQDRQGRQPLIVQTDQLPGRLQALLGLHSLWMVPYNEGGQARAWLLSSAGEGLSRERPGEFPWVHLVAALAGPLLARVQLQKQQHEQQRVGLLQSLLGAGWWEYRADSGDLRLAPGLAQELGLASEELPLQDWLALLHPAYRDEFAARLETLRHGGQPFVYSLQLERGENAWYRVQAARDREGITGFMLDIRDAKASEDHAATAQARLSNLIDSAPAVIYILGYQDGALRPEFYSNSLQPLLGWSLDDLQGESLALKVHPDDRERFFARTRQLLCEGSASIRYRLRDKQGEYHWLLDEAKLLRDELGQPREAVGLLLDVSEATLAAEKIHQSEERYRLLVEDSPAVICRYRPDLDLTFVNRPLAEYLDLMPHELEQANLAGWLSADQLSNFNARLGALSPQQPLATSEICLSLSGREHAWFVWAERGVFNDNGQLIEVQAVGRDNTELRKAQQQLLQSAKMATLGEMATGLAHEINQPLNVMRMAVANVLKRLGGGGVQADYLQTKLERIEAQIERASKIVDHLRVFGRRSEVEQTLFDPEHSIRGALSLLEESLHGQDIQCDIWVTPLSSVYGHADQLEQVLINLLVNARDALQRRRLEVEDLKPRILLRATEEHQQVVIEVEDNGGGIESALIGKVFEPFFTTKPVGKGTGLGLSVSYGIVQNMGGSLGVENTQEGACFRIVLPIAE